MNLKYRGTAYTRSTPCQATAAPDQTQLKLIYRGHIYHATPRMVTATEAVAARGATVTLVYRGNTYQRQLQAPQSYPVPSRAVRALDWRYQNS